jgi:hypothetical protein
MSLGGKANADRVLALCARARRIMEAGIAALEHEDRPCNCFYPDGLPRYTAGPSKRAVHRCGR